METVKLKLKKSSVSFSNWSIFTIGLFIIISIEAYQILSPEYDAENYETIDLLKTIMIFAPLFFVVHLLYLRRKNWNTYKSETIEIPKIQIKKVIDYGDSVKIQTKDNNFYVYKDDIENPDCLEMIPYKNETNFDLAIWVFFYFIVMVAALCLKNNPFLEKLNFKYYLPALQIETTQVNATYIKQLEIGIPFRFRTSEKHKVLIDNKEVEIRAVSENDLSNRIYNPAYLEHLEKGESLKIKIRTEDYLNLKTNQKDDINLRFYELEANGDILYKKRGLKEEFETATF